MGNCLNNLGSPDVFLTATAVLVAILLVWAQLWVHARTLYTKGNDGHGSESSNGSSDSGQFSMRVGLTWTYSAILLALVAFARVASSEVDKAAMSLFVAAFLMAVVNIAQSWFLGNVLRLLTGNYWGSALEPPNNACLRVSWALLLLVGSGGGLVVTAFGWIYEWVVIIPVYWIGIAIFAASVVSVFIWSRVRKIAERKRI